jgi:hypothetical protein
VVTRETHDIDDRGAVLELHLRGVARLDELRTLLLGGLAAWLVANCRPEDLVAPARGHA